MKKLLIISFVLTLMLVPVFAVEKTAELKYTVEPVFNPAFYISETEGTTEVTKDIYVDSEIFTKDNQLVAYTFGIWDATKNNQKSKGYRLSVATNGWRYSNGDIFAFINTSFTPIETTASTQMDGTILVVNFPDDRVIDRTQEGTGAVKIATLKAQWTVPNLKYHLADTYTAVITVSLESF